MEKARGEANNLIRSPSTEGAWITNRNCSDRGLSMADIQMCSNWEERHTEARRRIQF